MENKKLSNSTTRYECCDVEAILGTIEGYLNYKQEFNNTYNFITPNRPMYVVLEVNNYCNMRCKMCIKSLDESSNGKDNIEEEIFEKIISDAEDIGLPSIFLGGGTECTVNPSIKTMIKKIRNRDNHIDDVLITNGYLLDEELSRLLIELQWEKLFVSIDAANKDTYNKIRGKDLSVVESNLLKLIKMKEETNSLFPIIRVSFVVQEDNKGETDAFIDKWKNKVQIVDFQNIVDFSDMRIKHDLPQTNQKCTDPFRQMMIDCKGNIYPCCNEWSKYMCIGNIRDMTIEEAWNSPIIKKLRESFIIGMPNDICKSCLHSTSGL